MKVLFVHLGREHLGLEYLSAVLKQAGHDTALACDIGLFGINDNIFINKTLERFFDQTSSIIKKTIEYEPDLVCFSAYTSTLHWCLGIARAIKELRDVTTLIGGPHVTLSPESAMVSPAIDYALRGEAETVIAELAGRIENSGPVEDLPGIVFRSNGEIRMNPLPELCRDLDSLPHPDKALFEPFINIKDDYMTLTARGCIFNCSYCCEHSMRKMYGGGFRRSRSVASLIDELETMNRRYNFREVYFACPLFPPDKNWVSDFAVEYRAKIGKPFYCFGHVNFFDAEYAKILKEAGCKSVEFGVQTLNEDIRRNLINRKETNERILNTLSICENAGLKFDVDVIFRLPGEKEADFSAAACAFSSYRMLHRIKIFQVALFPGTDLLDRVFKEKIIDEKTYRDIMAGEGGDFFRTGLLEGSLPSWKQKAYENIFRLMPLFPGMFSSRRPGGITLKLFSMLPSPLVKLFEFINLVRLRDLRLSFYMRLYAKHFIMRITSGSRNIHPS